MSSFSCSYNFDKLASSSHLLFSSCGFKGEIVWTQTFWSKSCNGLWYSKWDLHWTFEFEPRLQFCWILSGTIVIFSSILTLDFHILCSFSIFPKILNYSYCFFSIQMTKLAIIPCTVFLETLFFGKRFRFFLRHFFPPVTMMLTTDVLILIYNNY